MAELCEKLNEVRDARKEESPPPPAKLRCHGKQFT
jgi:hypothetical protein